MDTKSGVDIELGALVETVAGQRPLIQAVCGMVSHAERSLRQKNVNLLPQAQQIIQAVEGWLAQNTCLDDKEQSHRLATLIVSLDTTRLYGTTRSYYLSTTQLAYMLIDHITAPDAQLVDPLLWAAEYARDAVAQVSCDAVFDTSYNVAWMREGSWQIECLEAQLFGWMSPLADGSRLRSSLLANRL